jgi:hypothetical protein
MTKHKKLYPGDIVEVRSYSEIAGTLDTNGCFESLPFMPEMLSSCGEKYTVYRRLEKTCVEGYGARLLPDTVTLKSSYCDGSFHDSCQRCCPVLWKEAWLRPIRSGDSGTGTASVGESSSVNAFRTRKEEHRYFCQSTELAAATRYLFPITFKRCTSEFRNKNVGLREAFRYLWIPLIVKVKTKACGLSSVQPVGTSDSTPTLELNLQPGEWVEVKQPAEIALTLDRQGRNRGLSFTPQMLPFCGKRYVVKGRVDRMILETTGRMRQFKHTVILEDVTCDGHTVLGGCSRLVYNLWREAWLRRVDCRSPH